MADALSVVAEPPTKQTRKRTSVKLSLRQALEFQEQLHSFALSPDTKPIELASCARAWCDLEERKRILRGKPLPGALKPLPVTSKRKPDAVIMGE